MYNTYKLMRQIAFNNCELTNEEIAVKYQQSQEPRLLATMFCRNYGLLTKIASNSCFYSLDKDEVASTILQKVNEALIKYDYSRCDTFVPFMKHIIELELFNKLNYFKHKGRDKVVYSLEALVEKEDGQNFEDNFLEDDYDHSDSIDLNLSIFNDTSLSEKEKNLCRTIMENPDMTDIELAEKLNVHRHTIRNTKQRLAQKFSHFKTCLYIM